MKLKSILSVFLVTVGVIFSCISAGAATYTPYGGITDSSSQANILYDYYRNLDTFDYNDEFLIMRSGQYEYYLFFSDSLSDPTVNYISYTATGTQYNSTYVLNVGVDSNFKYNLNEYTVVGNISGTGAYAEHYSSYHQYLIQIAATVFLVFFIFSIFRSHFKELT